MSQKQSQVYCTSYCNQGHRLSDGKPVNHACNVLPPEALQLERDDDIDGAFKLLLAASPMPMHRGVKE